ncbi:efflux RND transporter periplasmic adaptor subunit [Microterricola viridarii]|uniref:Multidrug resistance protein MdtA-like C-terminal permuted SH3 domain-containing protein n=1 Tax=Microterricola viridarii TaxID=412690 RepID=A0A0X8E3B0_9MICO|nr:hypothetical protein [Microterricola viridarii]AMB58957.1 hypothetical protein AWU67_08880 [Microterricola viridarii]
MGIARKWIFPIIRMLLLAALAVALVKIAFFPDNAETGPSAQPSGQVTQPEIAAALGDITNEVTLKGNVAADPAVAVKATGIGAVDEVFVSVGQWVDEGTKLYDIKVVTVPEPVEGVGPDGLPTVTQGKPVTSFAEVFAPISGTLTSLSVLSGQQVAVGDTTGQVAPSSFSVTGALSPEQQYRLVSKPTEALIAITGGPAPFQCTGLTISTPLQGASPDPAEGAGAPAGGSGTTVRCAVPAEVTVFAGLAADITIAAGSAEGVLTVPTTAVKGAAGSGIVWAVLPDGGNEERPVELGLNNGTMVEITAGLAEGDMVLEFVPGAPAQSGDGCMPMPDGSVVCSDAVVSK